MSVQKILGVVFLFLLSSGGAWGYGGPGLFTTDLLAGRTQFDVGELKVWNSPQRMLLQFEAESPWMITGYQVYIGSDPVPTKKGKPDLNAFPFRDEPSPSSQQTLSLDLSGDLGFSWGSAERLQNIALHVDVAQFDAEGNLMAEEGAWAAGPLHFEDPSFGTYSAYLLAHPQRGHFIDAPVFGLSFSGPTQQGVTTDEGDGGGFLYFPDENISFAIGEVPLGTTRGDKKVSPLDLFPGSNIEDDRVTGVARVLQTLDSDGENGKIVIDPLVAECFGYVVADQLSSAGVDTLDYGDSALIDAITSATVSQCGTMTDPNLVAVSAADAQANLEAGLSLSGIFRKNISKAPEYAATNQKLEVMAVYVPAQRSDGSPSLCMDGETQGVSYQEWRIGGDPTAAECDPREEENCILAEIECREVVKPVVSAYAQHIDLFADNVTTDFHDERFADDIFAAVSRDDGATWKRMNVSRMADLSSFDLESGEPFPGTSRKPQMKIIDNKILAAWTSTFCRGGNPRYSINVCPPEDPDCLVCKGDEENEVCEPDYVYDDPYYTEDIWGVSGHQGSVNYDEVDDVAELGIGEIPYSCLWAARGMIVTQADIELGTFSSMDDETTDEVEGPVVGDIVWFKPERLTSGRRDAYIPVIAATRGAGFAIAWQEDPKGLRPGKGKGPGVGWSGAISNHKTDIWYSYLTMDNFNTVDPFFVPGGEPDEDRPGIGRPKAQVPFSLPVRISDNDMVNTDTLKVTLGADGLPIVQDGSFVPVDPLTVEHGNATGTKRYAYLARSIDSDVDGVPDYQYVEDNGGTLDLCDIYGDNQVLEALPGSGAHERWFHFLNSADADKTVCITSDGRLLDGDVSASRPNISMQPYKKADGTTGGYVLLAYEETKGMGESIEDGHDEDPLTIDEVNESKEKPVKQDLGKNVIYHSFDFTQPDLISAGHIINLPALCGGLYPEYCEDTSNPTCSCDPGMPVPIYFDDADGNPDPTKLLQYRTEIARRVRFLVQSTGRMKADGGTTKTLGAIIYKQGQEGQGRPADVFIRRIVQTNSGNPYQFDNFECKAYLDQSFTLPGCPNDNVSGYSCNAWGEAYGDRLCGGTYSDPTYGHMRRDHVNLTSSDIDYSVPAGPEDEATPDDPTDDLYGTDKVLLWTQHAYNLGDESFGAIDGTTPGIAGMFSNARSHRGFIRGDFLLAAYAFSPNWAAARNGRDRYNFYIRKSFDGGQTWSTTPASFNEIEGHGVYICPEWRSDPNVPDLDGSGNAPPDGIDPDCNPCLSMDENGECVATESALYIPQGEFEPARNISNFPNNKQTSGDPRVGATPPVRPLDGRLADLPELEFVEDTYVNNVFFIAWGANENVTSTGGETITPEAPAKDVYYTRTADYGDSFLKIPWNVNPLGSSDNWEQDELVWRYDFLAHGEEEQGECQLRATPDGSKMYAIWHQMIPEEEDPDAPITRWYPWEPEVTFDDDVWFRRVIFWEEETP